MLDHTVLVPFLEMLLLINFLTLTSLIFKISFTTTFAGSFVCLFFCLFVFNYIHYSKINEILLKPRK